jgi:hypothetical protein
MNHDYRKFSVYRDRDATHLLVEIEASRHYFGRRAWLSASTLKIKKITCCLFACQYAANRLSNALTIHTHYQGKTMISPLTTKSLFMSSLLLLSLLSNIEAAQICRDDIPDLHPNDRYTNNNNGTVTDKDTGLMWKQCVEGVSDNACGTRTATTHTWKDALVLAKNSSFAEYSDWRIPNIKELHSLVTQNCFDPVINKNLFPNNPVVTMWSSSPSVGNSNKAWYLDFKYGFSSTAFFRSKGERNISKGVRLVRSGQ